MVQSESCASFTSKGSSEAVGGDAAHFRLGVLQTPLQEREQPRRADADERGQDLQPLVPGRARKEALQLGGGGLRVQPPQRADGVVAQLVRDDEQADQRGYRARRAVAHQQLHRLDSHRFVRVLELADQVLFDVHLIVIDEHTERRAADRSLWSVEQLDDLVRKERAARGGQDLERGEHLPLEL